MKVILFAFGIIAILFSHPAFSAEQIYPKECIDGPHDQPNGFFSIYVFCDDALGTNVAVFLKNADNPMRGKYQLGKRFWQGEEWSYDVMSYEWLKDRKHLLLSTSAIYGSGSLYLMDLEKQEFKVLYHLDGAALEIVEVDNDSVLIRYEVEDGKFESVRVKLEQP